jgi:hypothetical protein
VASNGCPHLARPLRPCADGESDPSAITIGTAYSQSLAADLIHQPTQGRWGLVTVITVFGTGKGVRTRARGKVSGLDLRAFPSWALPRRDVRSVSGQRVEWRSPVAHWALPAKAVRRSSEALQASGTFLGREPVAAGAATRGYGRVPLQGTCAWGVGRDGDSRAVTGRFHQPADARPASEREERVERRGWGGGGAQLGVRRLPPFSHAVGRPRPAITPGLPHGTMVPNQRQTTPSAVGCLSRSRNAAGGWTNNGGRSRTLKRETAVGRPIESPVLPPFWLRVERRSSEYQRPPHTNDIPAAEPGVRRLPPSSHAVGGRVR